MKKIIYAASIIAFCMVTLLGDVSFASPIVRAPSPAKDINFLSNLWNILSGPFRMADMGPNELDIFYPAFYESPTPESFFDEQPLRPKKLGVNAVCGTLANNAECADGLQCYFPDGKISGICVPDAVLRDVIDSPPSSPPPPYTDRRHGIGPLPSPLFPPLPKLPLPPPPYQEGQDLTFYPGGYRLGDQCDTRIGCLSPFVCQATKFGDPMYRGTDGRCVKTTIETNLIDGGNSGALSCGTGTREELVNGSRKCVSSVTCGGDENGDGGNKCGLQFGVCPAYTICVKKCGPPVSQIGDPDPGYSCLSTGQMLSRERYGCPICLSSSSQIDTPRGIIKVTELKAGDMVWTRNAQGKKIAAPILKTSKVPVNNHKVVHLVLNDGRSLDVSSPHPTANGKVVGNLKAGDHYDGSIVKSILLIPYTGSATYDLLPAGDTGYYWANGILMGSTLK